MSLANNVLVRVQNLTKHFPIKRGLLIQRQVGSVKAVDGVSFDVRVGEPEGSEGCIEAKEAAQERKLPGLKAARASAGEERHRWVSIHRSLRSRHSTGA